MEQYCPSPLGTQMKGRELSEKSFLGSHSTFSFYVHVACFNNPGEYFGFPGSSSKLNIINIETLGHIHHRLKKKKKKNLAFSSQQPEKPVCVLWIPT